MSNQPRPRIARRIAWSAVVALTAGAIATSPLAGQQAILSGVTSIFNGRDLAGWHVSTTSSHGSTPDFHVENGVLIGAQRPRGKGGLLVSDRIYGNVEVSLEVQPDFGCDGGLFLRSDEHGRAYQVMLDYVDGGNIGGIYGEGLENVIGSSSDAWKDIWKKDQWNTIRARIEGATPHIEVWLNDQKITDWTDTANHAAGGATSGKIALQVHSGDRWKAGGVHRFRAIAVRELR